MNSNKPAFPLNGVNAPTGLTKREYFAAMAMQGILASCPEGLRTQSLAESTIKAWAKSSSELADALIAELERSAEK